MMIKTALITGASSGIGEVFARRFAEQGYHVILAARSKDKLERLAAELAKQYGVEVHVIHIDLSVPNAASEVYNHTERLGKQVDILVNNAGIGLSGEFLNHDQEAYRKQVMLNAASVLEMTHLYLPGMLAKGSGVIINTASLLAFFPFPYCSVYSATKAFVLSFTESIREEYRHRGIQVLALCPGPTDTNFFQSAKDVETAKKRTPEQVVDTAMKALKRNKSYVIDGTNNYFTALLGRILPRKTVVQLFGAAMRKSIASKISR
ncbi:SDR family NAD(P)-dependent oxidoreductase [Paenibacillus sp. GCM10027628]|uniref:SDR family NAD(P)-dependent oxidoreductase n=1 Tax=Paenibacillus sp. GCM10027628 TaxID=3273413 RepID=UPI00362B38A5